MHIVTSPDQTKTANSQIPEVNQPELQKKIGDWRKRIDQAMRTYLPPATTRPASLHKAMRYSVLAGGKRLRPVLVLAAAEASGGDPMEALPSACAVEFLHTYSLIHDDLPCMDNDDLRRGRATCHKVYGEAVALLAGDALLTLALELAASQQPTPRYTSAAFTKALAAAAGSRHLIAGQVADMETQGCAFSRSDLRFIHAGKTAAMVAVSLRLGGMSANASPEKIQTLEALGQKLGLAFQVVDDILDRTQTKEKLGKSPGKDLDAGKATYPALLGLERARGEAARMTSQALSLTGNLGSRGETLRALATYLLTRED